MTGTSTFFDLDFRAWQATVQRVAAITQQTTVELLQDVMLLWGNSLIRQTYPNSHAQGRRRVSRDIHKVFRDEKTLDNESLKQGFDAGIDFDAGKLLIRPKMDQAAMRTEHERCRDRDRGRTGRRRANTVVRARQLASYIRKRQAHVGRLKAGWIAVCDALGGKVPAFVRRAAGQVGSESTYEDTLNRNMLSDGALIATNNVPYAHRLAGEDWWNLQVNIRRNDLVSGKYAMRWQKKMQSMRAS